MHPAILGSIVASLYASTSVRGRNLPLLAPASRCTPLTHAIAELLRDDPSGSKRAASLEHAQLGAIGEMLKALQEVKAIDGEAPDRARSLTARLEAALGKNACALPSLDRAITAATRAQNARSWAGGMREVLAAGQDLEIELISAACALHLKGFKAPAEIAFRAECLWRKAAPKP